MANSKPASKFSTMFAAIVIPLVIVIGIIVYKVILGNPANFEGGNLEGHPLQGNYLGMMYKGGVLVPILMGAFLLVWTVFFERTFTLMSASGKGSSQNFIRKVQHFLSGGDINSAIAECDKQKGSVANVIRAGLEKYKEVEKEPNMDRDQKVLSIQKEIEETTALELPMLERNLIILATLSAIATLMGLLGTVFGMIRAFSAIATSGAPDAVALSTGISEALINTALGISTSAFAIIFYNYFTTRIDGMTYAIDEAGNSITQTFAAKHKLVG
ncbi:MAG: MotA/TolQ/ExbB proton channel family protein [Saprospiraceae bacterium]|nr:MotA/TolQ/ExbB proton channel family protein [Saprospiraceae bacterium]